MESEYLRHAVWHVLTAPLYATTLRLDITKIYQVAVLTFLQVPSTVLT